MAEDNEDDRLLTLEAMRHSRIANDLRFVGDGIELLEYLRRQGRYQDPETSPRPGLILLDLKMPRMDGHTALRHLKADPELRRIPVVVLTTSDNRADQLESYENGAASYITKPVTFAALVHVVSTLSQYWTVIVTLPEEDVR